MRIIHVVRPAAGGIKTHVRLLSEGLVRAGHDIAVAAPANYDFPPGVEGLHAPITAGANPFRDFQAAVAIAKSGRLADLLHGHGLRGAWIAALASGLLKKPYVFTAHNLIPSKPGAIASMSLSYVSQRASAAICVSSAIAQGLRPYRPRRIAIIPNGIDVTSFAGPADRNAALLGLDANKQILLDPSAKWIVAVGRQSYEKGFDVLVRAAAELRSTDPSMQFIIAGPKGGSDVRALATNLGLLGRSDGKDTVHLLGHLDNVPRLFRAADVVVVPSRQEGQGIVALEAMAAGAPVIATNVGGLPETIGDAGVLIPPEDPAALVAACLEVLRDEARRERLILAGRQRVRENYTLERMVERTLQVYRAVEGRRQ